MKTYVLVGAGARGEYMFARPLANEFRNVGRLAGIYDTNAGRAAELARACGVPAFDRFDGMLADVKPDVVIVATVDRFHHEYAIRAMEAGCDVLSEKPMTTDAAGCRAILEAERRTGRRVTVTFNCRFMPYMAKVKALLAAGVIGTVSHVDFEWYLDTTHGGDYFRRWHRKMENSGGLLVHKATHHFDLVNWWLADEPETVFAFGGRRMYGPLREQTGERCSTCPHAKGCEFYFDLAADPDCSRLYLAHEGRDGYWRDRCVFSGDIDIMDDMVLNVRYARGALMSYSLIAYSPYEGWRATLTGSGGRMEIGEAYSGIPEREAASCIRVYDRTGARTTHEMGRTNGSHGGGDARLQRMLFAGEVGDPLGQQADSRAGAMSVLVGAAANCAIRDGLPVRVRDLLDPTAVG